MKTWVDFEPEVEEMLADFHTLQLLWWESREYAKPVLREDFERELRMAGSVIEKSKKLCSHGQNPLTCTKCYIDENPYGR